MTKIILRLVTFVKDCCAGLKEQTLVFEGNGPLFADRDDVLDVLDNDLKLTEFVAALYKLQKREGFQRRIDSEDAVYVEDTAMVKRLKLYELTLIESG